MSCRLELPEGEYRHLSPNFDYLLMLLQASMPEELAGTVQISVSVSGVGMEFIGARQWLGLRVDADIIPRWMFAELAFRELIAKRTMQFVELLGHLQPNRREESTGWNWLEGWALG